jgi:hypothetical protein
MGTYRMTDQYTLEPATESYAAGIRNNNPQADGPLKGKLRVTQDNVEDLVAALNWYANRVAELAAIPPAPGTRHSALGDTRAHNGVLLKLVKVERGQQCGACYFYQNDIDSPCPLESKTDTGCDDKHEQWSPRVWVLADANEENRP